jgi:hypothetical protein
MSLMRRPFRDPLGAPKKPNLFERGLHQFHVHSFYRPFTSDPTSEQKQYHFLLTKHPNGRTIP